MDIEKKHGVSKKTNLSQQKNHALWFFVLDIDTLWGYIVLHMQDRKKLTQRLNRIEGQIRGLKEMIEQDRYCIDIITQTSAVKSSLSSFEDKLLEAHLAHCVVEQVKNGDEQKAVDEVLKVYKLKRK
jgi:CsoR family transcriptional regulator, copper-sensing transcriptional repressor